MKPIILLFILLFSLDSITDEITPGNHEDELVFHLVQTYTEGEVVWLGTQGKPFLGLYREADSKKSGRASIILHGMGGHADWPEVVSPLRTGLSDKGWATLSIQLPVLAPGSSIAGYGGIFDVINTRIRSAIQFLQDRDYNDIVLIGYSFGATVAVNYIANNKTIIKAFAGISMQEHAFLSPPYNLARELETVDLPVLDIYADNDLSSVVRTAEQRMSTRTLADNSLYYQQIVGGANHYYSGMTDKLVDAIKVWLDTICPVEIPVNADEYYFL